MQEIMNCIKTSFRWYIVLMSGYVQRALKKKEWSLKMKEMQVDYLQGYYYGRPCEKEQFIQRYKCS